MLSGPVREIEKNSLTVIPDKLKLEYYFHNKICFSSLSCKIGNCHLKILDKLKLRYSLRSKILAKGTWDRGRSISTNQSFNTHGGEDRGLN